MPLNWIVFALNTVLAGILLHLGDAGLAVLCAFFAGANLAQAVQGRP